MHGPDVGPSDLFPTYDWAFENGFEREQTGHHGSAYSSMRAFVAAVHPHAALISVGRHNVFGHPAPSTLRTLRTANAAIYRTDHCGAITIEVTAERRVRTMLECR